jgi:hypothetical protein
MSRARGRRKKTRAKKPRVGGVEFRRNVERENRKAGPIDGREAISTAALTM